MSTLPVKAHCNLISLNIVLLACHDGRQCLLHRRLSLRYAQVLDNAAQAFRDLTC